MLTVNKCPYCAYASRPGEFYCENCGQALGTKSSETLPENELEEAVRQFARHGPRPPERFSQDSALLVYIRDAPEPLTIHPSRQMVLGRTDTSDTRQVDLDLTPYGALRKGVSRVHAILYRNDDDTLHLVDVGSANGTYVNGQRLSPGQPHPLHHGDEIILGRLIIHIYFERLGSAAPC